MACCRLPVTPCNIMVEQYIVTHLGEPTNDFWWIYNPMGSLKKFNLVVLWTTLSNCMNMQISAAITDISIFFNILATMHYIISKIVSTHMFSWSKNVVLWICICVCKCGPPFLKNLISSISGKLYMIISWNWCLHICFHGQGLPYYHLKCFSIICILCVCKWGPPLSKN